MYLDVERLLVPWLAAHLDVRVVTDIPADLARVLPVVQLARIGGTDSTPTLDVALMDVDCYTAGRAASFELAERVREALRFALPGQQLAAAYIPKVATALAPAWRPYDNTNVRRVGASYEVTVQSRGV